MAYEILGKGALDYIPCRYNGSDLYFRGPKQALKKGYCAVIGGTETYGKFIEDPYPALLADLSGRTIVNLGYGNAGAGLYLGDAGVLTICKNADTTIIEITGAQNISNKYYSVHPRRNDRFVGASKALHSLYPEVDFTEFHFTGHLLAALANRSNERFDILCRELRVQWVSRMKTVLEKIDGDVILLWLARHSPGDPERQDRKFRTPALIDRDMMGRLIGDNTLLVEILATPEEISAGYERMIYSILEEPAARQMLGPIVHQEAARELTKILDKT